MSNYKHNTAFFRSRPFAFIIFGPLTGGLAVIYWWIKTLMEKVEIKDGQFLYEYGILSKSRTELNLKAIRSVKVEQSLGQRIFGCGDVLIFTAGDQPEVTAKGFPEPEKLRDIIKAGMDK